MRFVAQAFVRLMEKYPFLETAAFVVIGILGIKLTISFFTHFYPDTALTHFLDGEEADLYLSILTVGVFVVPILTSLLLGYPKKKS
jgi:predicted tellurium resistance membrane protein TerC